MNLKPDEWNVLVRIDSDLCTSEPQLATKFRIFNRLAADDGQPPDEDLITAPRSLPQPVDVRAHDRRWLILIFVLLLPLIVATVLLLA